MPSITRAEWVRAAALALAIALLTSAPDVLGWLRSDATRVYAGATFDLVDYNSHLAKMQQGARGEWRYRLLFTSEDHEGGWVQTFYVALGHAAHVTHLGLPVMYTLARVVGTLAMAICMYLLIAALLPSPACRWIAYVLALAGSGLGWLQLLVWSNPPGGISPIDFWLIDGFPFFSALTFPHFTVVIALMSLLFVGVLAALDSPHPAWGTLALIAACSWVLTAIHPFGGGLALLIAGAYAAVLVLWLRADWKPAAWTLGAIALPAAPVLAYDAWLFSTQPVFRGWSAQNITLSPPPSYFLISYGLLLAAGGLGAWRALRRRERRTLLAIVWVVVVAVLLYVPTNLQRRFLEGIMSPLCVLASAGLVAVAWRFVRVRRRRRTLLVLLVAILLPSNLALLVGSISAVWLRSESVYYSRDVIEAVDWISANTQPEDIILSSFRTGNLIPAYSARRVFLGHWMETLDYARKTRQVKMFYQSGAPDDVRRAILADSRARYVFWGPDERKLGEQDWASVNYLRPVYVHGQVTLYQVVP